jgi:hypothetical protein
VSAGGSRAFTIQGQGRAELPIRSFAIAWSIAMLDIIMLAVGLGFFALSVGYTIACDRL